jgi:hypothetical protein
MRSALHELHKAFLESQRAFGRSLTLFGMTAQYFVIPSGSQRLLPSLLYRGFFNPQAVVEVQPIYKSAIRQVWKPAPTRPKHLLTRGRSCVTQPSSFVCILSFS